MLSASPLAHARAGDGAGENGPCSHAHFDRQSFDFRESSSDRHEARECVPSGDMAAVLASSLDRWFTSDLEALVQTSWIV